MNREATYLLRTINLIKKAHAQFNSTLLIHEKFFPLKVKLDDRTSPWTGINLNVFTTFDLSCRRAFDKIKTYCPDMYVSRRQTFTDFDIFYISEDLDDVNNCWKLLFHFFQFGACKERRTTLTTIKNCTALAHSQKRWIVLSRFSCYSQ